MKVHVVATVIENPGDSDTFADIILITEDKQLAETVYGCVKDRDWDGISELDPDALVDYDSVVIMERETGMILPQKG